MIRIYWHRLNWVLPFVFSVCLFFLLTLTAHAQQIFFSPVDMDGYAWSDTIGWISFNCKTGGPGGPGASDICSTSNYKVTIDANIDNTVTGYAWSDHIGWIKFGGVGTPPTEPSNPGTEARVAGTANDFTFQGWARACAATVNGNCTGGTLPGGWDGWISLQGTTGAGGSYRVNFQNQSINTGNIRNRMAWGSTVVGWVDFSRIALDITPQINDFTVTPTALSLPVPGQVTISYDVDMADSCTISNDRGLSWSGTHTPPAGAPVTVPIPNTLYPATSITFTLACNKGSNTVTETRTIEARPDIVITAFSRIDTSTANSGGIYPSIVYSGSVQGIPSGYTTVPYEVILQNGATTFTTSGTVSAAGSFTASFSNIPFGTYDIVVRVDNPPGPGVVTEDLASTVAINEDRRGNILSSATPLPGLPTTLGLEPPPPTIEFFRVEGDQSTIRYDSAARIEWRVSAPYAAECKMTGPDADVTTTVAGSVGNPDPQNGTFLTSLRRNTSEYVLRCVPTDPVIVAAYPSLASLTSTETLVIQVTHNVEEI